MGDDHPRERILRRLPSAGATAGKTTAAITGAALPETMMFRLKQLGERLFSRAFERQVAEAHVRAAILNRFTYLGMPQSVRAGQIAPATKQEGGRGKSCRNLRT